jgi:hypothetical protein
MADDEKQEQPAPAPAKSEQQIFDEQVAHASARAVLILGGIGIFAAIVMSTIALVNSGGSSSSTNTVTVTSPSAAIVGPATGGGSAATGDQTAALTGDALGRQLFVSGDPATGVIACGSCHILTAAGTTATVGPNLSKELTADPASATLESVVDPNKEIVSGYPANLMPKNYGTALTKAQLKALVDYVYKNTNVKAMKQASASGGGSGGTSTSG